jgi:hypothetical protein
VCADEPEEILCLGEWLKDMIRLADQDPLQHRKRRTADGGSAEKEGPAGLQRADR